MFRQVFVFVNSAARHSDAPFWNNFKLLINLFFIHLTMLEAGRMWFI
jgi:hypothetical protein